MGLMGWVHRKAKRLSMAGKIRSGLSSLKKPGRA